MTHDWTASNLFAWMEQACLLAALGSLLLALFRVRHPGMKLAYCHVLLAVCFLLPWLQPWRSTGGSWAEPYFLVTSISPWNVRTFAAVLIAGGALRLAWLLAGLWRIRRCRIGSTPLYPIPESVQAAVAVTQADAAFCVSPEIPGPVMLGWLAPVVLMPESFLGLGEDAQCGVACHELLHVRRHDWLVTVLEELAGTLLWFSPAIWPLLGQARLAREQLVDAEVVRLTASREPYIDALLAIAKGGSQLDLAPAPLFLRRRHLTQRVHSLLKEGSPSKFRIAASYVSITAVLAVAGWFGAAAFPLLATTPASTAPAAATLVQTPASVSTIPAAADPAEETAQASEPADETFVPEAPLPADPHELAAYGVRLLTGDEAESARALLQRTQRAARLHTTQTPPYRIDVSFTAAGPVAGSVAQTGPGQLTEIHSPGQTRWAAELADYSVVRWTNNGLTVEDKHAPQVPMRVQQLRQAIFWADRGFPGGASMRSAQAMWNGRPATCLLTSNWTRLAALQQGRLWEEEERCFDDATSLLEIDSIAPGTYTVYQYSKQLGFHGMPVADRITIYTNGNLIADASLSIADMREADGSLLAPQQGETAVGPVVILERPARVPMKRSNWLGAKSAQPVIVEAEIDGKGNVVEEELCAAADPALAQDALARVRNTRFRHQPSTQYQLFVNVKYMPAKQ